MFATRAPAFSHSAQTHLVEVPDWPRLPAGFRLYRTSMVAMDSRGFIYVTHRGENPVLCLNPDGTLKRIVGEGVFRRSTAYNLSVKPPKPMEDIFCLHGLHVDPWDNVWVTEFGRHLVLRFDPEGKLTLTLGVNGEHGCDDRRFFQPTHVCVVPSGEIFVSDGYGNSRMVKLSAQGKFIKAWGDRGTDPGQFHTPHAIALGADGLLYVSDRENDRVQIFDQDGALKGIWGNLYSMDGLCFAPDGRFYGSAGDNSAVIEFNADGTPRQVWSKPGKPDYPPNTNTYPHGIGVGPDGSIYIAETNIGENGSRLVKLRRR